MAGLIAALWATGGRQPPPTAGRSRAPKAPSNWPVSADVLCPGPAARDPRGAKAPTWTCDDKHEANPNVTISRPEECRSKRHYNDKAANYVRADIVPDSCGTRSWRATKLCPSQRPSIPRSTIRPKTIPSPAQVCARRLSDMGRPKGVLYGFARLRLDLGTHYKQRPCFSKSRAEESGRAQSCQRLDLGRPRRSSGEDRQAVEGPPTLVTPQVFMTARQGLLVDVVSRN